MTNKVARKTVDFGHGVKVTIERPYTPQDAIEEFKRSIEAAGGKVTQVQDELTVSGAFPSDVLTKATQQLTEDLGAAYATGGKVQTPAGRLSYPGLKRPPVSPLPFGFPSFEMLLPFELFTYDKGVGVREKKVEPKPKKVAQVAPKALSTWEFTSGYLQRMHGQHVHLVGQHYRSAKDQEVLGWKRVGNMALLVAEPDNPVDLNAVMVLVWNDVEKHWVHAGYVRATEAAALRGRWTGDFKNAMVARITSIPSRPDGHRGGRNIGLTLTGEVRTYPGYKL